MDRHDSQITNLYPLPSPVTVVHLLHDNTTVLRTPVFCMATVAHVKVNPDGSSGPVRARVANFVSADDLGAFEVLEYGLSETIVGFEYNNQEEDWSDRIAERIELRKEEAAERARTRDGVRKMPEKGKSGNRS